jgi:competence protein ComEC
MSWARVPAFKYFLCAVAGISLASVFPKLAINALLLLFTISVLAFSFFIKVNKLRSILGLSSTVLFFGILGIFQDERLSKEHYVHRLEQGTQVLVHVLEPPVLKTKSRKVHAEIKAIKLGEKWKKCKGQVLIYFNFETKEIPQYGSYYILRNNFRFIEEPKNPYEFDYKTYLTRKQIYAHDFVRLGDYKKIDFVEKNFIFDWAYRANAYTHNLFSRLLDSNEQLSVADALIAGQQSLIEYDTKQNYIKTGSIHALAVSGTHVALLFLILNYIFSKIFRIKPWPLFVIISSLLLIYLVFTGLSPSASRAVIMFIVIQLGLALRRESHIVNTLFVSALGLLVWNPAWLYDVGFQLSYAAVLGIVLLHPLFISWIRVKNKILYKLLEVSSISISAQIFTLPFSLYYFHQFPNYFLVVNPVVTVLSALILPLGLGTVVLSKIKFLMPVLGFVLKHSIGLLNSSVAWVADLPFSVSSGIVLYKFEAVLLFILVLILPYALKKRGFKFFLIYGLSFIFFQTIAAFKAFEASSQKKVCFHFIPRAGGISFLDGTNASFVARDSICNEDLIYDYHLKNFYDGEGVKMFSKRPLKENTIFKMADKKIVWLESGLLNAIDGLSYVMISRNAVKSKILKLKKGPIYIIDGSVSKYKIDRLLEQNTDLKNDIKVLYDTGSWVVDL